MTNGGGKPHAPKREPVRKTEPAAKKDPKTEKK